MPFPDRRTGALEQRSPILVTTTGSVPIPADARVMHAFIVGGGGSGGIGSNGSTLNGNGAGGGSGGALYLRVNLNTYRGNLPQRTSKPKTVSLTIGSGATAATLSAFGSIGGNAGGNSTLTIDGGFTVTVTGGGAGGGNHVGGVGGSAGGSSNTTFYLSRTSDMDGVIAKPLWAAPSAASDTYTGDGGFGGGAALGTGPTDGGAVSASFLAPWWLQAVGLSPGTGGVGAYVVTTKSGGGGGAGWGGNGGAGVANNAGISVTAGSGTGYGSGGGGVGASASGPLLTSGAGAPGCAVLMFEVEV